MLDIFSSRCCVNSHYHPHDAGFHSAIGMMPENFASCITLSCTLECACHEVARVHGRKHRVRFRYCLPGNICPLACQCAFSDKKVPRDLTCTHIEGRGLQGIASVTGILAEISIGACSKEEFHCSTVSRNLSRKCSRSHNVAQPMPTVFRVE